MTEMAKVRIGTRDDVEDVMSLCRILHNENGLFDMNEDKVREMLDRAWDRKGGIVGIIGERGKPEGCIYLTLDQYWYSDAWHLEELFNFVHPDFRQSAHAKAMIEFAKKCSDDLGVPLVIGIISNHRTEAKVRLYERQLPKAGAFFVYGARTGEAVRTAAT